MTKIIGINYKTTNARMATIRSDTTALLSPNCITSALLQPK